MVFPWRAGVATGIGSLPYGDIDEAAQIVAGELPDFVHLPELPGRGVGADMVGRTAAILVEMPVDLQPSGWRMVDSPGADARRATSLLRADLDVLEIALLGYAGPLKIQAAGPFTLAATIERSRGDRLLADHGARRDLAQSLGEGLRVFRDGVAARVPNAQIVVQVDEPGLPAVLSGSVPTASGFGRHRSVRESEVEELLGTVLASAGPFPVVHCCAAGPPAALLRRAGAEVLSVDVGVLNAAALDELRDAMDGGLALWPGIVPAVQPDAAPTDGELARHLQRFYDRLDADPAAMLPGTVVTPACGLAGATVPWARSAYRLARGTAAAFAELVGTAG